MSEREELEAATAQFLAGIQEVLQSGEILSEEFQRQIAETLNGIAERLDELYREEQTLPEVPELQAAPYPSSNINAFRYEPESRRLFVKFQGKYPLQNGPVYKYEGVPKYIVDVFSRGAVGPKTSGRNDWHAWRRGITPSHGAAMAALVKAGGFPYVRMS